MVSNVYFSEAVGNGSCGVAAVGCDDPLVVALELSHSKGDRRLLHRSQSAHNERYSKYVGGWFWFPHA
jgi:hypothetical protein